jgi:endonuclease YncB( thermonuclease family)
MAGRRKAQKAFLVSLITLAIALAQQQGYFKTAAKVAEKSQPGLYQVTNFTDGDTLTVDMNGTPEKVRFIGVDTPETHDPRKSVQCFGQAAANFTRGFIGNNRIRLEADPANTDRDRYQRLLRYVYLPDGRLVNAEIIKQGYGFAYTYFPFTKLEEFKGYQKQAETNKLGLWGDCNIITEDNGQIHTN